MRIIRTLLFAALAASLIVGCDTGVKSVSSSKKSTKATASEGSPSQAPSNTLRILQSNPRYFTVDGTTPLYFTGSHTWDVIQDWDSKPAFDYDAYLNFLQNENHNFIRMWIWEDTHRGASPQPWARTGPGTAYDGRPKYDLTKYDNNYFNRLSNRIAKAQQRGIYVSVMLFFHTYENADSWKGHPFNSANNINGLDAGNEYTHHTINTPQAVINAQKAYVRKVIDVTNQYDNVLYEIGNELWHHNDCIQWQEIMMQEIRTHEATKPKQHLVGINTGFGGANTNFAISQLDNSSADWYALPWNYTSYDPPATTNKPVFSDTDHIRNVLTSTSANEKEQWAWKSFFRGLHPIHMEAIQNDLPNYNSPSINVNNPAYPATRDAQGATLALAERLDLARMVPSNNLASTGYCLAQAGKSYAMYFPNGGSQTLNLSGASGVFKTEWIRPRNRTGTAGANVNGGAVRSFSPPFGGDAILYLELDTVPSVGDIWSTSGPSVSGWAYDHESNPTKVQVIVKNSPVHASPKVLGTVTCDKSASASQDTSIRSFLSSTYGVTAPAGYKFVWGTNFETWLKGHSDTTASGVYTLQFKVMDEQTGSHILLQNGGTSTTDFPITINLNVGPTAPTQLYVGADSAQSGASGNPVTGLDLTPVFSAIFNDPNAGDTASKFRIQVSDDSNFTTSVWLSDPAGDSLTSPVTAGQRCADIDYAGSALSWNTTYYWRVIFQDAEGVWSPIPSGQHSFKTAFGPNLDPTAPTALYVDSSDAQAGSSGNPVADVDLSPVFSAVFNDPNAGDVAQKYRIQVATDSAFVSTLWVSPGAGVTISDVANGGRCADIAYGGANLSYSTRYYWRIIFQDQRGAWSVLPTGEHSFTTVDEPNTAPTAPTTLYVDSQSAQSGASGMPGSPVTDVDLTPAFSAVFNDPNAADSADRYRIQVSDNQGFTSSLWLTADEGAAIGPVAEGDRCPDIAYGGSQLQPSTTYYWRIIFRDSEGAWSPVSAIGAFTTEALSTDATITTSSLPDGQEGSSYLFVVEANNGVSPYSFAVVSGAMPTGITIDADGTLSGKPATGTAGDHTFTVQVIDAVSDTDQRQLTLTVAPAPAGSNGGGGGGGGGGGCVAASGSMTWQRAAGTWFPLLMIAVLLVVARRRKRSLSPSPGWGSRNTRDS